MDWKKATGSRDVTFKIILVGNADVGKSSLIRRYTSDEYDPPMENTVAVDCVNRDINIDSQSIKLNIWDTAGSERYHSLGAMYYRNADGIIFVFDVSVEKSFVDIQNLWWEAVSKQEQDRPIESVKMLVGTKIDMLDEDELDNCRKWELFANQHGMNLHLVSAKDGSNVDKLFYSLAEDILKIRRQYNETVLYNTTPEDVSISLHHSHFINTETRSQQSFPISGDTFSHLDPVPESSTTSQCSC